MESSEISPHEVRVFSLLSQYPERWFTNREIAKEASVADRTARLHSLRLVKLGLLDIVEVFPANKYRWSPRADKRNPGYLGRLKRTSEILR